MPFRISCCKNHLIQKGVQKVNYYICVQLNLIQTFKSVRYVGKSIFLYTNTALWNSSHYQHKCQNNFGYFGVRSID